MATTVFRVEKNKNYTIISNHHLQDKNISLKAKGLLTLMLSLPPNWDMTLNGLVSLSGDGIDSVRSGIKELEKNGYLSRSRGRNERGQLLCTEYIIHEQSVANKTEPQEEIADENQHNISVEPAQIEKTDMGKKDHIGKSDVDENSQVGKSNVAISQAKKHTPSNDDQIGFPYVGKPYIGKSDPIKYLDNQNTDGINNPSSSKRNNSVNADTRKMDREAAYRLAEERQKYELLVKANIDYDAEMESCLATGDEERADFLKLVTDIMVDTITSTAPTVRIKKQEFPTEVVKSRFLKIGIDELDYIYTCLQQSKTKIINVQNYIRTALYNSLFGSDVFYRQWVQHDNCQRREE